MKNFEKVRAVFFLLCVAIFVLSPFALAGKVENGESTNLGAVDNNTTQSSTSEDLSSVVLGDPIETMKASPSSPNTGEQINWQVISSGGQIGGISNNYRVSGTIGQVAVGAGGGATYNVSHGFWQNFASSGGNCDNAGDANHDGGTNVGDAVYLINYVFKGGPAPPQLNEADANNDCGTNVGDAVYLINYVFKGGPAPICGCAE